MKKNIKTADELSEISKKTKRAIYKNKYLPYAMIDGARKYDLKNPLVIKWLNGESIIPRKAKTKIIKRKPTVKKKSSKKVVVKKTVKKKVKTVVKNKEPIPIPAHTPNLSDFEIPDYLKKLTDSGQLTFSDAMGLSKSELEKIKIYEQIKEIKTKAEQRREGLIDKKLVRTVFSKIYEIDMNQFVPLKEKLIPDIAAIMGCKNDKLKLKASKKLDDELWKILANIKRELNKFLVKIGESEI